MDNVSFFNIRNSPRLVRHAMQARTFGILDGKTQIVDRDFESISFSFLIKGTGFYRMNKREWKIKAPCVLVQLPGKHYTYGPYEKWDEFYVTYERKYMDVLTQMAWQAIKPTVISFPDEKMLAFYRNGILACCEDINSMGNVDRIDLFYEKLLLEVILARSSKGAFTLENKVFSVKKWIELHFAEPEGIKEIAGKFAFSERTLLRNWHQCFGGTPGKYLMEVRIRKACEMLVSTDIPICEIAHQCGFEDELYFSRRFHIEIGDSPRSYRKLNLSRRK